MGGKKKRELGHAATEGVKARGINSQKRRGPTPRIGEFRQNLAEGGGVTTGQRTSKNSKGLEKRDLRQSKFGNTRLESDGGARAPSPGIEAPGDLCRGNSSSHKKTAALPRRKA